MSKCVLFPQPEDQLSITIQDETRERQRKVKERNHLVSIGIAGFRISDTLVKHRNIDPKDARKGELTSPLPFTSHGRFMAGFLNLMPL